MTAGGEIYAYHLGIVVRDLQAACARYSELLHVPRWHYLELERAALPSNPKTAGGYGNQHVAFGRVPGATFELIQPEGKSVFTVFLEEHGEGLQHLGVWTPDVQASVREAVDKGCRVTHAALTQDVAAIQLSSTSTPEAIIPFIGQLAYVDAGLGSFQIEFVGTGNVERIRDWFAGDTDEPIPLPPWYQTVV
jgi:catechol 2,3-dioxygenase-like lactoylglutathione lyase family enzyme